MECPDDELLHGFVEGLLSADELQHLEAHLERCSACRAAAASASAAVTVANADDDALDAHPGPEVVEGRIGRYAVLGDLGAGAMGIVLRAYDPKLEREVALKILRGELDVASSARLVREAKAMAQLNHPNVVGLYDVEIEPDCVVVVMELVRGETLADRMRRKPGWQALLECFTQAGQGLAAAHDAGLLHRDFKPTNVLVGDDGRVRVTDFGIARAQTHNPAPEDPPPGKAGALAQALTEVGAIVGTPAYMAPEQHRGLPLTTAADQYAFAASLFEAMTGTRPYQGSSTAAVLDAKLGGPPSWPRDTRLPAWLQQAITRGLASAPEDRFPSMEAMLHALAFRTRSARRRHALIVGVATVAGAVSIAALLRTPLDEEPCADGQAQLSEAWTPTTHAQMREAFLGTRLPFAQQAWDRDGSALESYASQWNATYVDACQATTVERSQSTEALDLRMACLHRARRLLAATTTLWLDADPDVVARSGAMVEALPPLSRCSDLSALRSRVAPPSSEQAPRVEAVRRGLAQAKANRLAGKYTPARDGLNGLRAPSNSTGYEPVRTEFLLEDAALAELESDYAGAASRLSDALRLGTSWGQWAEVRLASRMSIFVAARRGRFDEAMALVPMSQGLAQASPDPADIAELHATLGAVALIRGRPDDAEPELRTALEGLVATSGPSTRRVARVRANLAAALVERGRHREAIAQFREQIAVMSTLLGPGHPDLARTRQTLGNAQHRLGHLDEAEREHQAALQGRTLAFGDDHPEVADSLASLSAVHIDQGRYEEAETEARAALELIERHHGPGNRAALVPASHLARVLSDRGRYAEAEAAYRTVIHDATASLGPDSAPVALLRGALGHSLYRSGQFAAAQVELRGALAVRLATFGPTHRQTVENRLALARCLFDQHQRDEASALYEQTLTDLRAASGQASAELATALGSYGEALLDAKRLTDAVAHLQQAVQMFDALPEAAPRSADAYFALARARVAHGRDTATAMALARQARDAFGAQGVAAAARLAAVEQWLTEHQAPSQTSSPP
ncbi:MAG: serine/threonine-protein kinase [Deltaproteobacteria bacterium]|nr:serine/threonine-protein kinase [Deltaproteobacteria bacterium]